MDFSGIADIKRKEFILAALEKAAPHAGRVLDVGCGNGIITAAIAKKGYEIKGIDSNAASIGRAREAFRLPNLRFELMSVEGLGAAHQHYDAIICSEVLEHLQHPEALLRALHASLKNEGILIVTVPNGLGPRELLVTRPVQWIEERNGALWQIVRTTKKLLGFTGTTIQSSARDLRHVQFFSMRSLRALAKKTGFGIQKAVPSNFIEHVFPFSLLTRKIRLLQRLDYAIGSRLPLWLSSGFMTIWKKL